MIRSDQLPEVAVSYGSQPGLQLAATHQPPAIPLLEGDLHALGLIDLDSVGLGWYREGRSSTAGYSLPAQAHHSAVQSAIISEHYPLNCNDTQLNSSELLAALSN